MAERICKLARQREIASYLDGARLWNAAIVLACKPAELAAPFDLVGVSLSKGLGAPGGSLLAGSKALIEKCVRHRRMLGGAMRQVGIFAASGIYAIENNYKRLAEDHANARLIAERLVKCPRVILDMATVQTNILVFHLGEAAPDGSTVVARAKDKGVLVFAFGPRTVRLVTHLDVTRAQCASAADTLAEIIEKS
jgi:threonine aldolase